MTALDYCKTIHVVSIVLCHISSLCPSSLSLSLSLSLRPSPFSPLDVPFVLREVRSDSAAPRLRFADDGRGTFTIMGSGSAMMNTQTVMVTSLVCTCTCIMFVVFFVVMCTIVYIHVHVRYVHVYMYERSN